MSKLLKKQNKPTKYQFQKLLPGRGKAGKTFLFNEPNQGLDSSSIPAQKYYLQEKWIPGSVAGVLATPSWTAENICTN